VLHPAIGFIGFEKKDQVELSALLQYTAPKNINWEYAQAGHSPWIPLHQINVQRLTAEEIFDDVKDSIGNKPLIDIPKSNKRDVPPILGNKIGGVILRGAFALLSGLGAIASIPGGIIGGLGGLIPSSGGGGGVGRSSGSGRPGFMSRIMNWMQQKIEDLERERDSELKRLSDMFEKNMDEFLQYAIPLSSPYLNRGTATPGSRLTKNPFQFNLGRLGGGQAVDGWNLDKYHDDLRSKYLKAAQQAIDKKDYKKAAYVYAHLLGDYAMAASTLKQGKHYREAAILYKEHLNNNRQAAECYQEGGLYVEAIELYTELQEYEKAGDLYVELGQQERALSCYEDGVNVASLANDYLEQSRIITEKIGNRPRAKEVLLKGWQDVKQPEACLTKYFDMLADDNKEQLHDEVNNFYAKGELKNKKLSFLNVIDEVNKKYKTTELENTCRNIAYEVVSEEVSAGNKASLHQLKGFIANDQLLSPDCYRFIHTTKELAVQKPVNNHTLLVKDVAWKKAITWQNQILIWGIKPTSLVLARVSSEGPVEYASWPIMTEVDEWFVTIADPQHTNNIVLYAYGMNTAEKVLVQNKYFHDQLRVFQPQFIHANVVGIGMCNGDLITLHHEHEEAFLNTYSLTGGLKLSVRCSFKEQGYRVPITNVNELIRCNDYYYLACDNMVLRISDSGEIEVLFYLQGFIKKVAVYKQANGEVTIGFYSGYRAFFINTADDPGADPFEVSEEEILIKDIAILPGNRYVVANEKNVLVYCEMENDTLPKLHWQYNSAFGVAAIFEGMERNQLGIVEANGKISFHVIN
jgi:tetratricopeptide (TPR) repeat protein